MSCRGTTERADPPSGPCVQADAASPERQDVGPYRYDRRRADDFLFASPRAKTGRVYQASSIFARCVERAGLGRNITPHTLRHTAATNAAHAGLDSATIQGLGGWKTRAMADRYTHAANLSAAMDALGARLSGRVTPKLHHASGKRR